MTTATATFWLTVVAGLGLGTLIGTLLSGLISSSIAAKQREHERLMRDADHEHDRKLREEESKRADAAQRRGEQGKAYAELLTASALVMNLGGVLRLVQVRSGSSESVGLSSTQRKPFDPIELDNLLRRDYEPLIRARTNVWLVGSQAAIDQANRIVNIAAEMTGMSISRGKARDGLSKFLLGERWTKAQSTEWQGALQALDDGRKAFREVARHELGSDFAESFLWEGEPKAVPYLDEPQPEPDGAAAKPEPSAIASTPQIEIVESS
jgi:hypothetical protein